MCKGTISILISVCGLCFGMAHNFMLQPYKDEKRILIELDIE